MTRVTITIEGESGDIREALLELLGNQAQLSPTQGLANEAATIVEAEEDTVEWNPVIFREFWSGLNPNAKRIMTEIAHHPEGIGIHTVRNTLGIEQGRLAGQLAPVGRAMNRLHKRYGKRTPPRPFEPDYQAWVYRMDPDVAQMILNSIESINP